MTSTTPDSPLNQPQPSRKYQRFLQPILQRSRFGLIGSKVFIPVIGIALLGMAGTTFLFSQVVKYRAEAEIQTRLSKRVYSIDSTLAQANTLAKAFRTSLLTLHAQDIRNPETYRKLTLELFKARPTAVTGLGFGQSQNGLVPEREWLFSYFLLNSSDPNAAGQPLPKPDEKIRYVDGTQSGNFYPESDRYRNFFQPQTELWTLPYQSANGLQTSNYSPFFDEQGKWLGTVFVDVDSKLLQESLAGSVLNQAGFFSLLTPDGQLVSASLQPINTKESGYWSEADFDLVRQQIMQGQSGLITAKKGYWAFARVPQNRWLILAFVPYEAVFSQLLWISLGGTSLIVGLMILVLVLTVRSLNRRLSPVLKECDRLNASDAAMSTQDGIAQISEAFFKLLEQAKTSEAQVQETETQLRELEAQLQRSAIVEVEQHTLQTEVEHLLRVVESVESGDLLVTAQAGSKKTGKIADALNRLVRRLEEVMGKVVSQTEDATKNTQQIQQLAALTRNVTYQQIQEADHAQTLIQQISTFFQEANLQAIAATEAVENTRNEIDAEQAEISAMVQQVNSLRQGIEQLVKRTQTLTDYVELTTQFAKEQKRIAAMTRVLATNASMLSNRASGQQDPEQFAVITREFETIAKQVNQLASQTNQSLVVLQQRSDQIQTVVSGLDYDLQAINQQINLFDVGVDRSQHLFEQAQVISDCVVQLRQQFTNSHQVIAATTQTTLESIHQISEIASTTINQADLTQTQTQKIEQQMQTLLRQVEFFKLQPVQHQSDLSLDLSQLVETATKSKTSDI